MGRETGLIAVAACVALAGCKQEQGIAPIRIDQVAVAAGDFDRLEDALFRNDIRSEVYEGYINSPVYDIDEDATYGVSPLQVEKLFTELNKDGEPLLFTYDALFLNSGVRGLGEYVYNDVETDDALVTNTDVVGITKRFVSRSRTLVVSDWAYDLVEAAWPDKVTFLGEHEGFDSAQRGTSASVVATVTDKALKEALGTDQLEVFYDFSYWTVMESVGPGVDVHMRGDVEYRADDGSGTAYLQNVPLLVSFDHEGGRVILSSFAWRAQRQQVADTILLTMIEGLDVAATGDQQAETSDGE